MQRMMFARLLPAGCPRDRARPSRSPVDARPRLTCFDLVKRWHGEQRTVLTALHDIDFVPAPTSPRRSWLAREPSPGAALRLS